LKEKQNHEKIFLEIIKTALKIVKKNYATIYYVILNIITFQTTHHNLPADA